MVAFWKRMREYFGANWIREYGDVDDEAIQAWQNALKDYGEDQIARGVKACQNWQSAFPPTLGAFLKLCLTVGPEERKNFTDRRIENERKLATGAAGAIQHLAKHALSDTAKHEVERMKRIFAGEEIESKEESMTNLGLHRRWQA